MSVSRSAEGQINQRCLIKSQKARLPFPLQTTSLHVDWGTIHLQACVRRQTYLRQGPTTVMTVIERARCQTTEWHFGHRLTKREIGK